MMRSRKDDANGVPDGVLREQLLANVYSSADSTPQHPPTRSQVQTSEHQQQQSQQQHHVHGAPPQQHHGAHNIDPAIAGPPPPGPSSSDPGQAPPAPMMSHTAGDSADDAAAAEAKKAGKRELSTSKRAAQNRAAQRAFRQRKEGHIKKLEEQVREYGAMMENYKRMQNENYSLREYIISLQSRLLESQGEVPPAPLNIDLHGPRDHAAPLPGSASGAPPAPMNASAASALQGIAKGASGDVAMADRTDPALTSATA